MTETVIEPAGRGPLLDVPELVRHRALLSTLVRRDLIARYRQTILGPLWFVVQPLLTTAVMVVVFSGIGRLPTDGVPPPLFYLAGLVPWSYFLLCLTGTAGSLVSFSPILSKVWFPRLLAPLSHVLSSLAALALQLLLFVFAYAGFVLTNRVDAHPGPLILLLPLLVLWTMLAGLGPGLILAAATARFRDAQHLLGLLVQLWTYLSPVVYPMSMVPPAWRPAYALNPMAGVLECFRSAVFGTAAPDLAVVGVSLASTLILALVGLVAFRRVEGTFVDSL